MENKNNSGIKETTEKLNYELDWDFITSMAEKMSKNKHKYPPNNWKKPIDLELLKQALFRHTLKVMKNEFNDETELDNLASIALNSMFIYYQLTKNNVKK